MRALRLILGDQLTQHVSALDGVDIDNDVILLAEVRSEATYVKHHKKKIAYLFSAMRHFAQSLRDKGFCVHYTDYMAEDNAGSLADEVALRTKQYQCNKVICTFPGEYRVLSDMQTWSARLSMSVDIRDDSRFIASIEDFSKWATGKKQLRMEFFYREMRKKLNSLMTPEGQPEGGKWNYDAQNRKTLPKTLTVPPPTQFAPDAITQEVLTLVGNEFADHFGKLEDFHYAVTREDALTVLDGFIQERLEWFGDYQDAMAQGEPWMFHSHIALYLNAGLLTADEIVQAVEAQYHAGNAPLNAVEGFIRQVIGWREYVRGLYWFKMPGYEKENFLNATRPLPDFYWTADTQMNCLKQCVQETSDNAYAHHIQRLMVLGNFALLAGLAPEEVNNWYLLVYADAYEWVEMPNVSGMVLFADGGVLASKPYAASGAYINKMSNYCKDCHYKVKDKTGESACPFNYLYWDFLIRNRETLKSNHRMGMIYNTLNKMDETKAIQIQEDASVFFRKLDNHEKV